MSKQEKKKKEVQQEDSQSSQAQQTTNQEKDLSQFIEDEEKDFEESDYNADDSPGGISGIESTEATKLITNLIAPNIPAENRQEFLRTYPQMVNTILDFVDFEDLTAGANVKDMPGWVRILILVVGLGGFTFVTVKKYQPDQNYDQQNQSDQNQNEWRE